MIEVRQTTTFSVWVNGLRDSEARARIASRIDRLTLGNFGDSKSIGEGVSELRINYGPGYRLYFTKRGSVIVILLCGGDKSSQSRDIARAKGHAKEI
ncbi:type II toxin-antitoxin system RelE/ParE family toxin [Mesorhizobium sp. AaZ16]|uniref:type II toxin-antitoxin system RelE/ParE family toxin n=1 Tax=Mesorhizobium sp. AaZ16 TaxID=3402289 RepID=UPI00374E97CA